MATTFLSRSRLTALVLLALLGPPCVVSAEQLKEESARLIRREPWSSVFGDQDVTLHFGLEGGKAAKGTLYWSLKFGEDRKLRRGETEIEPGKDAEVALKLPPVKQGVILPVTISASFQAAAAKKPAATLEQTIWIFPSNPFHDRTRWLEELNITVYDPVGATVERLTKDKVPHEHTSNIAGLEELQAGLVLIGEGISLREDRALPEILTTLAGRGISVLCLQPVDGEIALPGTSGAELPAAAQLILAQNQVIRRLDKRLDDAYWGDKELAPAHRLRLAGQGSAVVAEVGDEGYPWLEMSFPGEKHESRFVVTTFPIIERWDDGPTPRFLLAEILEFLSASPPDHSSRAEQMKE